MQQFRNELGACWRRIENKSLFLVTFGAWVLLFHFLGNSTFGYIDSPSLLRWMYNAYTAPGSDDAHGLLIPFAVVWLFWWKREQLLLRRAEAWAPAILMLALAVLLHVFGYMVQQARISIVAFFVGIYALIGLAWGRHWLKTSFFPFVLFAFCIPIGSMELIKYVTVPLRTYSAAAATAVVNVVLGFGVVRHGTQIFDAAGQYSYDVNAACSGIRSLVSLFVLMLIYGVLTFQSTKKRVGIVLVSIPLAVVGNVLRLLTIIITAEVFGQKAGDFVHEWSGFLTYALALACALLIGKLWGDDQPPSTAADLQPEPA